MKPARAALPLALLVLTAGCVRRAIVVESEPAEAEVWIDGERAGLTPVRVPYSHYGSRQVTLTLGGYALVQRICAVEPPWYERFPLDFFTENLWPWTLVDERYFFYTLQPEQVGSDEVYARAKAMRDLATAPLPPAP